jgi:hypothetical protein
MSRWFLGPALPADPLPAADELAASEFKTEHHMHATSTEFYHSRGGNDTSRLGYE